jgi:hypothetical protein
MTPAKNEERREGSMPLSWTVHIPQAMQRHGGSVRPSDEPDCDEAMARLFRSIRAADVQTSPCDEATVQADRKT